MLGAQKLLWCGLTSYQTTHLHLPGFLSAYLGSLSLIPQEMQVALGALFQLSCKLVPRSWTGPQLTSLRVTFHIYKMNVLAQSYKNILSQWSYKIKINRRSVYFGRHFLSVCELLEEDLAH